MFIIEVKGAEHRNAGMIMFYHGKIPGNNDVIRIGNIVFKVLRASTTRLELVNLKID